MRRTRDAGSMGEMINTYKTFRKPERKTSFGRPRRRLEDDIRIGFREVGWVGMDWMHLA